MINLRHILEKWSVWVLWPKYVTTNNRWINNKTLWNSWNKSSLAMIFQNIVHLNVSSSFLLIQARCSYAALLDILYLIPELQYLVLNYNLELDCYCWTLVLCSGDSQVIFIEGNSLFYVYKWLPCYWAAVFTIHLLRKYWYS